MAWTRGSWMDLIGTNASKTTITFGNSSSANIDCNGTDKFVEVDLKVAPTFGATPDGPCTIEVFSVDADGANENSNVAEWSVEITEATSAEKILHMQIHVLAKDTIRITITNDDSTDSIDVWVAYLATYWS